MIEPRSMRGQNLSKYLEYLKSFEAVKNIHRILTKNKKKWTQSSPDRFLPLKCKSATPAMIRILVASTAKQFHVPSAALSLSLWPVIVLYWVKMPCDDKAPNNEKHSPSKEENHCIDDGLPRYLQKSLDQNQISSKSFAYCGPQEGSWE